MPFYCDIAYKELHLAAALPEQASIRRWCAVIDQRLGAGDPLVELDTVQGPLLIRVRFRCFVESIFTPSGQVGPGDLLARVYAEGEDIPEGFRYCTVERLPVQSGSPAA